MMRRRPLDWAWVMGLPLALVGVWAAAVAIDWLVRGVAWQQTASVGAIAVVLGGIGWFIAFTSYRQNQSTIVRNRLSRTCPDEPWRWRPEWEAHRIEWTSRAFGTTVLELDTLPGRIGGQLRGTIVTAFHDRPTSGFVAKLSAIRVYVTAPPQRAAHVHRPVLWEASQTVSVDSVAHGLRAPFTFDIPPDAPPTRDDNPNDEIVWQLVVTGEPAGRSFKAVFVVPVFENPAG